MIVKVGLSMGNLAKTIGKIKRRDRRRTVWKISGTLTTG